MTRVSIVLAAVFCFSCADDDDRCFGDRSLIVPLEIGTQWVYRNTVFDATEDTLISETVDTLRVLRDTVIEDQIWAIMSWSKQAWANLPSGHWIWYQYEYPPAQPYFMAKFPASAGDEFVSDFAGDISNVTVSDTAFRVSVPWGTVETYHYIFRNMAGETESEHYFAPGVGRVKSTHVVEYHTGPRLRVVELMSFSIPGC
jgi:hypothetical protein